jgi:hypothetical protein
MKVIAIIEDPDEVKWTLRRLVKIGRSPPGFDADCLNESFRTPLPPGAEASDIVL